MVPIAIAVAVMVVRDYDVVVETPTPDSPREALTISRQTKRYNIITAG